MDENAAESNFEKRKNELMQRLWKQRKEKLSVKKGSFNDKSEDTQS